MTRQPVPLEDASDDPSQPDESAVPPVNSTTPLREPTPEFIERVCIAIRGGASPFPSAPCARSILATGRPTPDARSVPRPDRTRQAARRSSSERCPTSPLVADDRIPDADLTEIEQAARALCAEMYNMKGYRS